MSGSDRPILPQEVPGPHPDEIDAPFWEACRNRRLLFQRCEDCGRWRHPPAPVCPACQSTKIAWEEARGPAFVYSATRAHFAAHPSVAEDLPYIIVVVAFPDCGGIRLISNLAGDKLPEIGAEATLIWESASGMPVPRFRLANDKRTVA